MKTKTIAAVSAPASGVPEHWPLETATTMPLAMLRPSELNPRKTFPAESLRELADSLREHGLLQPIICRPFGSNIDHVNDEWINVEAFEVICGERRLRASKLANIERVPVIIRPMNDDQVLALMLVENDQREDVLPSEQAAAYRAMVDQVGAEATAKAAGKPIAFVRATARLALLPKWCLDRVDDGTLSRSAAAVIARVPGETPRERAAAESLGVWVHDGDPWPTGKKLALEVAAALKNENGREAWNVREAKQFIRQRYCRELKGAPFNRKALDLIPDVGSCDDCPKRAGNDPELLAEGVREDVCTDTNCYASKVWAWKLDAENFAREKGWLDPQIEWPQHYYGGIPQAGWLKLDEKIVRYTGDAMLRQLADAGHENKLLKTVLGKDYAPRYFTISPKDEPLELVKASDVRKHLIAEGVLKKEKKQPKPKDVPLSKCTIDNDKPLRLADVEPSKLPDDELRDIALGWLAGDADPDDVEEVCRSWLIAYRNGGGQDAPEPEPGPENEAPAKCQNCKTGTHLVQPIRLREGKAVPAVYSDSPVYWCSKCRQKAAGKYRNGAAA